jgi:hypothetical protein
MTLTSKVIDLEYAKHVELQSYLANTASASFTIYVDAKLAGQWVKVQQFTVKNIAKGGAEDSTWTENFDNAWGVILRSDTCNHIPGANIIRIRNLVGLSSTTYGQVYLNQNIMLRK